MTFQELMDCYTISDFENNDITYKQLVDSLTRNNVTPVIGAGLSHWAYPLWGQMLRGQASYYGVDTQVEELLQENNYEEAASLLEEVCTHNGFIRMLRHVFRPQLTIEKSADCPKYLKLLPMLFRGPIVTTNFDRVIEYLFNTASISQFDTVTPLDDFQSSRIEYALQTNTSVLVKMHGDVEDPEHLVLTKQSYDNVYGGDFSCPDFEKPMAAFLKKILERNPLLFLGCSLSADRTCSIIKCCAGNCQQFAFLELPKETENERDPMHPILLDSNGRFIAEFQKRRNDIIGNLNICPIWYPYGMHTQAFFAFFTKLAEDLNILPPSTPQMDMHYIPLHQLLGREDIVNKIVNTICVQEGGCIWVDGPGGIGKTEICKAVYAKLKEKYPSLEMPYIDITGTTNLLSFFDAVARGAKIICPSDININDLPDYFLHKLEEKYSGSSINMISRILYFDNWEDIWYGLVEQKEQNKLIQWIQKLLANNFRIIVSSREFSPTVLKSHTFHVMPLDYKKLESPALSKDDFNQLDSVKLFYNILGRDVVDSEWETFQSLIYQLEGHPLAIVLTATQAQREISIGSLMNRWYKAKQDAVGIDKKHTSLDTALKVSWDAIGTNPIAVLQWGLHYYSIEAIPQDVFQALCGDTTDEDWQEGLRVLIGANLVYITQDRQKIAMLLPLKKQFGQLTAGNQQIHEDCLILWARYIENLLDLSNQSLAKDRLIWHQRTVNFASQIFYVMEQFMEFGTSLTHQYLNNIVIKVRYYYQFFVQSVTLLEKLTAYYKKSDHLHILATVLVDYGDLLRRLGDVDGAKEAYDSAEPLYRQERANLGLANLLKSRGDLLSSLGDVDGAKEAYDSAEPLYRQERTNLGLANLLQSRGDLLCRLGDVDGAKEAYDSAEPLYRQERDNLGLANLLQSRGDLLSRLGDVDSIKEAYEHYKNAEKLYRDIHGFTGLIYTLSELYECCMILNRSIDADLIKKEIQEMLKKDYIPYKVKEYVCKKLENPH